MKRRALRVAAPLVLIVPLLLAPVAAGEGSLKEAIPGIHIQGSWPTPPDSSSPGGEGGESFLGPFWRRHRMHLLWVFTAQEVEHLYSKKVGVSEEPLLFRSVPGVDAAGERALSDDTSAETFVAQNKTNVFRFLAAGTILAADATDWRSGADDLIGLLEAQKFDSASTGMVKMIVGRRRPAVEQGGDPGTSTGSRESFYSYATSQAFTMASYLDGVAGRRLDAHPVWRGFVSGGLYGLAGYIGYTRLEQGEHHLTDVLAGAGAGFLTGHLFYRFNHAEAEDHAETGLHHLRLQPPVPLHGGFALMMSVGLGRGEPAATMP